MNKTIHFVAGLPRSGSTLFVNILNQNPEFHATGSSGLVGAMTGVVNAFDELPFFKAMEEQENLTRRKGALLGMMQGYFADTDKPVCFDKNRNWPAKMEMLKWLLGDENVKVICCMRDIRDVLASFEILHRKTSASGTTTQAKAHPVESSTAVGRASILMRDTEVIGSAKNILIDALSRGHAQNMFCLDYHDLCGDPEGTMRKVYSFLGHDYYQHDFDNVEAVTVEDDRVHGFKDLHKIRPKVEPQGSKWDIIYDDVTFQTPFWQSIEKSALFWRGGLANQQ